MPPSSGIVLVSATLAAVLLSGSVARAEEQAPIAFAGGAFTIEQSPDDEKVLKFNGTELYRQWEIDLNRIVTVGDLPVALFWAGPGGNACGPATLIVTVDKDEKPSVEPVGEDCGSPDPAVTLSGLYFVPYVLPGGSGDVEAWEPGRGLYLAGKLAFEPQPNTDWTTLDARQIGHPVAFFDNAAIYQAARRLVGESFSDFVTGLSVSSEPEKKGQLLVASGCVPHSCGSDGSLIVVDPVKRTIFAAMKRDGKPLKVWPARRSAWPKAALAELDGFARGFQ